MKLELFWGVHFLKLLEVSFYILDFIFTDSGYIGVQHNLSTTTKCFCMIESAGFFFFSIDEEFDSRMFFIPSQIFATNIFYAFVECSH